MEFDRSLLDSEVCGDHLVRLPVEEPPKHVALPARPNAIAVSETAVYTGDSFGIYAAKLAGATGYTTFAKSEPVLAITTYQGTVAWVTQDSVWTKSELTSEAPKRIASSGPGILDVALDGTHVYWVDAIAGTVNRCARSGCAAAPETVAWAQDRPKRVRLWDDEVFWLDASAIRARKK